MYIDRIVLLLLAGSYLLSPAVISWWSHAGDEWYRPYLLWAALIGLGYWMNRGQKFDDL